MRTQRTGLSRQDAERLLAGHPVDGHEELAAVVSLARVASTVSAPIPSETLSALLEGRVQPVAADRPAPLRSHGHSRRRAIAVSVLTGVSVTFGAAAANALPAPLQNVVADAVRTVTSIELPRPATRSGTVEGEDEGAGDGPVEQPLGPSSEDSPALQPTLGPPGAGSPSTPTSGSTSPARDDTVDLDGDERDDDEPQARPQRTGRPEQSAPEDSEPSESEQPDPEQSEKQSDPGPADSEDPSGDFEQDAPEADPSDGEGASAGQSSSHGSGLEAGPADAND